MDTSKITNVLIFKDGFYWLTILNRTSKLYPNSEQYYSIIPQEWGLHNGFEFASDAYAYIASLSQKKECHITLDMKEEIL